MYVCMYVCINVCVCVCVYSYNVYMYSQLIQACSDMMILWLTYLSQMRPRNAGIG